MKTFNDINRTGNPQNPESEKSFENINEKDELLLFGNKPERPAERRSNEAVKGAAWLLGIVAIFAVAILFAWIVGSHTSRFKTGEPTGSFTHRRKVERLQKPGIYSRSIHGGAYPCRYNKTAPTAAASGRNVTKATSESKTSSLSAADEDRIEREAREVIHGDFRRQSRTQSKTGSRLCCRSGKSK